MIAILLIASACGQNEIYSKKGFADPKKASEFIVECSKAANPMSDEEGEDLVSQCEQTAIKLYGRTVYYIYDKGRHYCESIDVDATRNCWNKKQALIKGEL